MDFLGPGGGNKTICRGMGSKMKKKILLETPFLTLLPTYSRSVCVSVMYKRYLLPQFWFDLNFKGTYGFVKSRGR